MSIRIRSYGGPLVWCLRKHCSGFTSKMMLSVTGRVREKKINAYIQKFMNQENVPDFKFLMLETINRCNGVCAFCPANAKLETREFKRMTQELFERIISQLFEREWEGKIFLQVNNEPFIDVRILKFATQIRESLPKCKICIITNGTLLTVDKMQEMHSLVDELVINDYSSKYRLSKNLKEVYRYIKRNAELFSDMEISISRRYTEEILATRAGNAPNKPQKNNRVNAPCIYPFTDMIVFPDGQVGMCCNDCKEITNFGDVEKENLFDIWRNEKFGALRKSMIKGRENYAFCKECDVVDAGSREKVI